MRKLSLLIGVALFAGTIFAEETKYDPNRPVCELGQTEAVLQWSTQSPCETKVQFREGGEPCKTWRPAGQEYTPWKETFSVVEDKEAGKTVYHRVRLTGLKPGTRYYYRLYDAEATPTVTETRWGAEKPWSREYAFSTLSPEGYRTMIRVPVKVVYMPNVFNLYTAKSPDGKWAPLPELLSKEQVEKLRAEFELAKRFLFVNNGFRIWHDLQYFVDERPMYWGVMPDDAPAEYKALIQCRSFAGVEFTGPGGGRFSIVDTKNLDKIDTTPVYDGYVGQIENALVRKYDWRTGEWRFMTSGGGTLGIDGWCDGVPGRSQFLGDDIAWLTTHEYHHEIESQTYLSGLDTEFDRVKFDHFSNRFRYQKENGEWDEFAWDCGGKFGEHWSGIATTDRELTDIQWLRYYFGETISVKDADNDNVPDDGPYPFTEEKYGYNPTTPKTDGVLDDFTKIRGSIWSGGAMSPWYSREVSNIPLPKADTPDSDGDGIYDIDDPLPTIPYQPKIWALTAEVDGDPSEWENIPYIGNKTVDETTWTYKQGHDDSFYFALLSVKGPFREINIMLDGEADGIYNGYQGFGRSLDLYELHIAPEGETLKVNCRSLGKGFTYAVKKVDDTFFVEFSIENRGESTWFWQGGGREIGNVVTLRLNNLAQYTLGDGYQPVYCFMERLSGVKKCPVATPAPLTAEEASVALDFSKNPDLSGFEFTEADWEIKDGTLNLKEDLDPEASCYLLIPGFTGNGDFTVFMEFEAEQDGVLGAFAKDTKHIDPGQDSIGFVGGYGNEVGKIRLINAGEVTDERVQLTPGKHTMQFQRAGNYFFLFFDNENVGWYRETSARGAHRLGVVGIPESKIKIHKLFVKGEK